MRKFVSIAVMVVLFALLMLAIVAYLVRPGTALPKDLVLDMKGWPQWRGPMRNGVVPSSPPLMENFPEEGPEKLWTSEEIASDRHGGWGSMAVVDGRVYFLCHKLTTAATSRILKKGITLRWGWAHDIPEDLSRRVEEARLCQERRQLTDPKKINKWAIAWLKANLKPEHSRFRFAAKRRIELGDDAPSLEALARLASIEGREFADQVEFDSWFKDNSIDETIQTLVMRQTSTKKPYDFVYCLDAETGKTLWMTELPSQWLIHPDSSTPCVVGGRCYIMNSQGRLYCLDARTGRRLWHSKQLGKNRNHHNRSSSVLVVDGMAVLSTRKSTAAVNAYTGKTLWKNRSLESETASSVAWRHQDKTYILVGASSKLSCLDSKTGQVLWSVPGGNASTPTIVDDYVVFCGGSKEVGLTAYRLSVEKPVQLWNVPFTDTHASPVVYDGYVYVFGESYGKKTPGRGLCVELSTGKVCWDEPVGKAQVATPIVADGKIITVLFTDLYMIRATQEKFEFLGKMSLGSVRWIAPAIVDGRLFVRTKTGIVCYDLRKRDVSVEVHTPKNPSQAS